MHKVAGENVMNLGMAVRAPYRMEDSTHERNDREA